MDAAKLRNSCICGNSEPYATCCAPYSEPRPGEGQEGQIREYRRVLHDLHMHLFPLRMLYQQYWEKLSQEDYPHHALMEDGDYGRSVVENFFWDYSVQYSDARPILRTAREIESRDLRLGHDLLQWSFIPLWPYFVVEADEQEAHLRQVGHGKVHKVWHDGRIPPPGHGVWLRLLPFRGQFYAGMARLATPGPVDPGHFEALAQSVCRDLGVRSTVAMRPDVHCDEWRRHGSLFLAQWRQMNYDAEVGRPERTLTAAPVMELSLPVRRGWTVELASHPKVKTLTEGRYEIRHRSLALARLELREGKLWLSLFDPVFASAVARIMASLGMDISESIHSVIEGIQLEPESGASMDAWLHAPHAGLGGQTPIQASTHDFGRRRLKILIAEMRSKGRDVSGLLKQLGL